MKEEDTYNTWKLIADLGFRCGLLNENDLILLIQKALDRTSKPIKNGIEKLDEHKLQLISDNNFFERDVSMARKINEIIDRLN